MLEAAVMLCVCVCVCVHACVCNDREQFERIAHSGIRQQAD